MTPKLEPLPEWTPNIEAALQRLRAKQAATQRNRQRLGIAAGTTLVVSSMLAFGPTRAYTQRCLDACVAIVNPAASENLTDQDGQPIRFANFSGRVVLVNFFATWCEPCRAEVQWLNEFQREYGPQGLSVVAVSLDEDGWKSVCPFLAQHGVAYPVVLDHASLRQRFGEVRSLPTSFFLDRNGVVVAVQSGRASKESLESQIRNLLAASKQM